jgi:predicted nucleic acid-binding protein
LEERLITSCQLTGVEFLHSARNAEDRAELVHVVTRAWDVQRELTAKGRHRSAGAVDLLVAATAELQGLTMLHCDHDFETIASVTGQPTHWLAAPGSL